MDNARVLVIGAGVNGSACAAALFAAGINVTVLARGERYAQVRDEGIVIENPLNNTRSVTKVPVIDHLEPNDLYDYVLVVVRKNQIADLLPVLAQNPSPNVVFMGNNLLGPDEYVNALGKDRVMLGFVFAGGRRDGNVIRAFMMKSPLLSVPFGEIDGTTTPRLRRLARLLRQAGFHIKISRNIVDFLTTHGAVVALLAQLLIKHECDTAVLAQATDDLRLLFDARREAFRILRVLGCTITPWTETVISVLPARLQIAGLRILLNSKFGKVGCSHVSQAPDEMRELAAELRILVDKAGVSAPAIGKVLGPVTV